VNKSSGQLLQGHSMSKSNYFIVKSAGGIASQLMALSNAIYVSELFNRPFKFVHYTFGTGVYYPFGISELLKSDELSDTNLVHRGYKENLKIPIGRIVEDGPLQLMSMERVYGKIRGSNLDAKLRWLLRKEWALSASQYRLDQVSQKLKYLSGGYPPIKNEKVHKNLSQRFSNSNLENPYLLSRAVNTEKATVTMHYRIGDMRFKYLYPTAKGDGIVSPIVFKQVLSDLQAREELDIHVVSENPMLAKKLLEEVGIKALYTSGAPSIWQDLATMCRSKYLISPYSTVSIFAAWVRDYLCLETFFPEVNSVGIKPKWDLGKVNFYKPVYLTSEHWIYQEKIQESNPATYSGYSGDHQL
jgi:hypothetical protein